MYLEGNFPQSSDVTLTIIDLHGRSLRSHSSPLQQEKNRIPVAISGRPAGLYLLKVQAGEASWVEKFVVK